MKLVQALLVCGTGGKLWQIPAKWEVEKCFMDDKIYKAPAWCKVDIILD